MAFCFVYFSFWPPVTLSFSPKDIYFFSQASLNSLAAFLMGVWPQALQLDFVADWPELVQGTEVTTTFLGCLLLVFQAFTFLHCWGEKFNFEEGLRSQPRFRSLAPRTKLTDPV